MTTPTIVNLLDPGVSQIQHETYVQKYRPQYIRTEMTQQWHCIFFHKQQQQQKHDFKLQGKPEKLNLSRHLFN